MQKLTRKLAKMTAAGMTVAALALLLQMGAPPGVRADETDARRIFKAMSDYMAAQKAISFAFDADLEVVTTDHQKIALLSSGTVTLSRPDKIRATRHGGFANVELVFNGKTLTLAGKSANLYAQADIPGTIDHLIDELRIKYNRPLPAADLLMGNIYDELMPPVTDVKDLGSGVVGGIECDHLAFRTEEVDWQIWIAQGARPYPCRYVITSKMIDGGPQYSVQVRDWKTGDEVEADDFSFNNATQAKKVDLENLSEADALPEHFAVGGDK